MPRDPARLRGLTAPCSYSRFLFSNQLPTSNFIETPGGGGQGIGQWFDQLLWPGVGHLNYLAVPGVGIFEVLFVPMTTNHFSGWEISVIFDLKFLPGIGILAAIFWKMSNPRPMPASPPAGLTLISALDMNFVVRDGMENTSVTVKCRKYAIKFTCKLT